MIIKSALNPNPNPPGIVLVAVALTLLGVAAQSPAIAEGATSDWVRGYNNEARLHAGRVEAGPGARLFAGVEISMPAGWKTYWRTPGEAGGVPPEFDWSASENLKSARVLFPAPQRLTDKSGSVIGYKDRVLFPIEITAIDAAKPVTFRIKAAYGVCNDLCIPAEAEMSMNIPAGLGASTDIAAAVAAIPQSEPRVGKDPSLASWSFENEPVKPRLILLVADPAGGAADAFVEAPDGLYMPLPRAVGSKDGETTYEVDLSDGVDVKSLVGKALTVTLTGAKGQSETTITLR